MKKRWNARRSWTWLYQYCRRSGEGRVVCGIVASYAFLAQLLFGKVEDA